MRNKLKSMKSKILSLLTIVLVILLHTLKLYSSNDNSPQGARSAALGNASVTFADFWAIQNNQAGLADFKNIAAGVYYENRFLLKELSLKSVAFVLPTKSGTFGININYFGFNLYNESKIGLAYAKSFGKYFSAGIQLDYLTTSIGEDYGSKSVVTFEFGLRSQLNENLCIAAHVFNPIRVKIASYDDERIPTIFKLGLSYTFSKNIIAVIETEKDINYKAVVKAGLEYQIIKEASVRIGITTNPCIYTFGFGLILKKFKIDFASSIHQVLGYSPQISLIYIIK